MDKIGWTLVFSIAGILIGFLINHAVPFEKQLLSFWSQIRPNFDWGSFFGGLVGAGGAFLAAALTIWIPRLLDSKRKSLELKTKLSRVLRNATTEISGAFNSNLGNVLHTADNIVDSVEELQSLAGESNRGLRKVMRQLLSRIESTFSDLTQDELTVQYLQSKESSDKGNDKCIKLLGMLFHAYSQLIEEVPYKDTRMQRRNAQLGLDLYKAMEKHAVDAQTIQKYPN